MINLNSFILYACCITSRIFHSASSKSTRELSRIPGSTQTITNLRLLQGGGSVLDEVFKACVDECNSKDFFYVDEYVVFLTTQATSYIFVKGQKGRQINVQPLRKELLDKNNSYIKNYWKKLPDYEVLPKPLYKIFANYACLYPAGTTTDTAPIISFCGNPKYAYTEPPFDLAVSFSLMKPLEKGAAIQRICDRFGGFWDNLVFNVEQYYKDEGLILDIIKTEQNITNATKGGNEKKKGTKIENKNATSVVHDKNLETKSNGTTTTGANITTSIASDSIKGKHEDEETTRQNLTIVHIINATIEEPSTSIKQKQVKTDTWNKNSTSIGNATNEKKETVQAQDNNKTAVAVDNGTKANKNQTQDGDKNTSDPSKLFGKKNYTVADKDKNITVDVKNNKREDKNSTGKKEHFTEVNTTDVTPGLLYDGGVVVASIETDQNTIAKSQKQQQPEANGIIWGVVIGLSVVLSLSLVSLLIMFISNHRKRKSTFKHGKAVKVLAIPGVVSAASDSSLSVQEKVEMVCQTFDDGLDQDFERFTNPSENVWASTQPAKAIDKSQYNTGFPDHTKSTQNKAFEAQSQHPDKDTFWNIEALSWERYAVSDLDR